jgi:riboflavin synthase
MFTGIITHLGKVEILENNAEKDLLLKLSTAENAIERKLEIGCSIAVNGTCLTLVSKESVGENVLLTFQASRETCEKTTLEKFKIGEIVNLEFALRVGDELGGHMVSGHVDEVVEIVTIEEVQDSHRVGFRVSKELSKFIAEKGSAVINGVSLTVNESLGEIFFVNIIPHTFINTNFKNLEVGGLVNLEIDLVARYLARLQGV